MDASAGGICGWSRGGWAMAQAEIAAAEASPVGTIQTPFDFHLRTPQSRAVSSIQPSMRIARVARCYAEAFFPLRKKARLQKVIRGGHAVDARQAHFFYQRS